MGHISSFIQFSPAPSHPSPLLFTAAFSFTGKSSFLSRNITLHVASLKHMLPASLIAEELGSFCKH